MQMMRLLLLVFTISFTASLIAQDDICSNMTVNLDPDGNTVNILGADMTTNDGSFVASGLGAGALDQYYWFTSGGVGTYSMDIIDGIAVGTGPYFLGVAPTCAGPFVEISMDAIDDGTVEFCSPTGNFILAIAADPGNEGDLDIDFSFTPFENDDCLDANQAAEGPLSIGANTVDNTCSSDGMVWHEYVVPNDATSHQITFSISSGTAAIGDIFYDDCSTPFVNGNCADPGSVLYVESGDNTPVYGSYDITVVDTSQDIAENTHLKVCPDDLSDLNTGTFVLGDSFDNALWSTGGNQNDGGQISGGVTMTILYYTSQADAELGSVVGGGVITPYPIDVTTLDPGVPTSGGVAGLLYARVEDNVPGGAQTDCWEIVQVTLEVVPPPVVTNTELTACETGFGTGMYIYELEDAESANGNADGQNTSAATDFVDDGIANATVVYYDDMANALADNGVGIITAPYTIDPTTLTTPNTIYAQVTDDDTGCFAVAEIALVVSEIPEAVQQADLGPYCNGEAVADILFDSDDPNGDGEVGFLWEDLATDGTISIGGTVTDSGTGDITGWVATNTTTAVVTATITVTPYTFGLDGVDDLGLGDDCIDPTNVMTFEIEVEPSPANDVCDPNATIIGTGSPNNASVLINQEMECATLDMGEVPCAGELGSVWFVYTVSADIQDIEVEVSTGLNFQVYTDACTGVALPCGETPTCLSQDDEIYIAVYGDPAPLTGSAMFDITVTEGDLQPTNVNCAAATDLVETAPSTTLIDQTNNCGELITTCALTGPTVWYQYTVSQDIQSLSVTITPNGTLSVPSDAIVSPSVSIYTNVNDVTTLDCNALTQIGCDSDAICLLENQIILIAVTTADGTFPTDAGDFDITVDEGLPSVVADHCSDNDIPDVTPLTTCVFTQVMVDNTGACPEAYVYTGCGNFDTDPVVYTQITIPTDVTAIEIEDIAGPGAPYLVVTDAFTDCDNPPSPATSPCLDVLGADGGTGMLGVNGSVPVVAGNTYYIIVGSDMEGVITFNMKLVIEPINDDCIDAIAVGTGMTNACADLETGEVVGTCVIADEDASVWFTYTVLDDIQDLTISLTPGATDPIMNPTITAYINATDGSTTVCGDPEALNGCIVGDELILQCLKEDDVLLIAVNTIETDAGTFDIAVDEGTPAVKGDVCSNAIEAEDPNPLVGTDNSDYILECGEVYTLIENPDACPDPEADGTCVSNSDPGIWYYFEASVDVREFSITGGSYQLFTTTIQSPNDPAINDCTALTSVGCPTTVITDPDLGYYVLVTGSTVLINPLPNPVSLNEDCLVADATLLPGIGGVVAGNNACASGDVSSCHGGNFNDGHVVYFEYTTGPAVEDIIITLDGGIAPSMTAGSITVWEDCTATITNVVNWDLINGTGELCAAFGDPNGVELTCVDANTTLIIAVGSEAFPFNGTGPAEAGNFELTVTPMPAAGPPNNDCANAEDLQLATTINGTTLCASQPTPITTNCGNDVLAESTVWYEHVVTVDGQVLSINVEDDGTNSIPGDIYVGAMIIGCQANDGITYMPQTDPTLVAEYCGPLGTDLMELSLDENFDCLETGDEILIVVSTESGFTNQGTFNISIVDMTDPTCQLFEDCTMPNTTDFGTLVTNPDELAGDLVCVPICNVDACGEDMCGIEMYNTIYYQFTTDADPAFPNGDDVFLQVALDDILIMDDIWIQVFDSPCAANIIGCTNVSDTGPVDVTGLLAANTTYTVMIGTGNNLGGTADLCITVTTGCVNDICDTSILIDETDPTPTSSSTNNCTQDPVLYDCGNGGGEFATAWFTFEFPATGGFTGADVTTSNIMPAGTGYGIQAFDGGVSPGDCTAFTMPLDDGLECNADGLLELRCLIPGNTYYIMVGSQDTREIDFDIEVDFLLPGDIPAGQSGTSQNDLCDDPLLITNYPVCGEFVFNFDNNLACPDIINAGTTCDTEFGMDPTVWYQIDLPETGYGILVDMLSTDSYLAIFEDACPVTTPVTGDNGNCVTTANMPVEYLGLTGGNTYYIAMANPIEGTHAVTLTIYEAPEGDDPNGSTATTEDDIIDLGTGGGSAVTTTCCAVGNADDPAQDPAFVDCAATIDQDAVWFTFITDDSDGFDISVVFSGAGASGGFEVYNVTQGTVLGSSCNSADVLMIPNCMEGDEIRIKVGSESDECGEFTINVEEGICTSPFANICDDVVDILEPVTDGDPVCGTSCNMYACTEQTDCAGTTNSVWFALQTDGLATNALISVNGAGFTPVISIFGSNGDCTSLTPALNDCETDNPLAVPVSINTLHFINISSADGGFLGDFDICIGTLFNTFDCYDGGIEVLRNETGLDPDAPVCPGETVTFCVDFDFIISSAGTSPPIGNNCQWVQGIIPVVQNGWDLDANPLSNQGPAGANWFAEGEVDYNFANSQYSSVILPNGNMGIEYLSGGTTFVQGELLPAGWFYTVPGTSPGCVNSGDPDDMFGDSQPCGSVANYAFCFDLTAREPVDEDDCNDPVLSDMSVDIFVFADGEVGCWNDLSCALSVPMTWDGTLNCDFPPDLEFNNIEICTGSIVDGVGPTIQTADNSLTPIYVTAIDNPDVTGENDFTFMGSGTINDVLVNNSSTPQIVVYEFFAQLNGTPCPGPIFELEVTVYPELLVDFDNLDDPEIICFGEGETFAPNISGGSSTGLTYDWSNGSTGPSVTLMNDGFDYSPGDYQLCVVVTDDNLNCSGQACFNFQMRPELILEIRGEDELCLDCEDATDDDLVLTYVDLSNPQIAETNLVWDWSSPTGGNLANTVFNFNPGEFIVHDKLIITGINEITDAGLYEITLSGQDELGCEFITEPFELTTIEGPEITIDPIECTLTGFEYYIESQPITSTRIEVINKDNPSDVEVLFGSGYLDLEPGCYTIISDYSDVECLGQVELVVEAFDPAVIVSPDVCAGSDGMATVENCGDYASIAWDLAGNTGCNYMLPALSGDVSFTITLTDERGCEGFAQVEINTFDAPSPTITGATSFCSGGSTTLGLSDSYQLVSWSTGDSGASTIVDGTNDGTITVTVTDFNGCMETSEVTVSEDTVLQIAGDSVTVCNDAVSTAVFDAGDANPSFSFVWDAAAMANGVISGANGGILTTSVAGTYIVTVTDAGCSGTGEFVLEYEEPQVVILTPEADICNNKDLGPGSSVDLTDNASPTDGSWIDDNLVFGGAADFANLQFDGLLAGDYQFTYCVSGVECGDACETIMITVEDCNCPVAVVGSIDTLCNDIDMVESINLDNREIPSDAGTWTWNGPSGGMSFINPGAPNSSLEIPVGVIAGDYSIVYTLDGLEAGCGVVADTLNFVINEAQTVTITEQVDVCNMDTGVGQICIDFDTLITAGVTMGNWIPDPQYELDGGDFSNVNNVCFDGLSVNSVYIFTFMGSGAVAPCQPAEGEVRVEVKDCDCKDPSTIALPIVCAKDTTITLADYITSDTDPGSWSMTNDGTGDILTITMTSSSIIVDDNTAPGTYVFLYENADPNGGTCIEESQQTLTIFEPIFVDLTMSNLEACNAVPTNGGTLSNIVNIEALLTPGSDPSGVWTDNFGLLSGGQSIDNIDFMTMPEIPIGTVIQFTYTVTSPDGDPCPDEFVVVTVSIVDCTLPPCPSLLTDPPSDLCTSGGSVDLTLLENISEPGTWSLGTATNGGVNSTVDLVGGMFTVDENSAAGTYEVAFKLDAPAIDCDSISTQMITVVDPLVVSFNPATACNQPNQTGGALSNIIDLTSYFDGTTTSMIGNWTSTLPSTDLDLSDPTMVDFANLQASSPITITFTTTNGTDPCGQAMGDLMVTVTDCDCPNLVVDPLDPVCNSGATIDLSVESETDDTVDGSWSEQAGNPTTGVLTGDIVTIDGTSSVGLYTFIFTPTIMPNPGCPETSMVTLTVNQAATAGTPSSTVFCDSETGIVILSDLLTGEDSGGTWIETSITPSGGFDATAGTFTVDNEGPNEYLFTYTVAGVNPCLPASEEVMVIIEAEPVADAGLDAELTCEMMSSNLNGLGTSTGDYTYTWTNAAGDLLSESVDSFNLLAITEGTYILTVLDNVTGCSNIDTAIVTSIDGLPTVTVDPCTDMGEGILFINVDGSNLPLTLEITGPSGDVQTVEYNSSTIDQIDGLSPGSYSVTLFDDTGCSTAPVAAVIFSAEDIVNNATDEIDTILQGTLYTLYATDFIVDGLGDYEILWTNETDPLNPVVLCQDPPDDCQEVEILVERIERICLTLTDVNGCVNQDCIDLRFRLENEVFTPNIFNPGDDLDGWVYPITDKEALVTQFTVFDRWGNVIFVRQNFPSNMPELGWDGTYNGVDAEQGVYIYVYSVTFPNDEVIQVAKDVTLTR